MTRESAAQPAPAPAPKVSPRPHATEPQHEPQSAPGVLDRVFQRYHPPTGNRLEPAGAVQLTKSAELVLKTLIKREVYAPSQTLDDEQKKIINAVVPRHLDAEELVALAKLMGARSGTLTPIPQLVIEAIQKIRPDGKKRPTVRPKAPVPAPPKAPRPKAAPSETTRPRNQSLDRSRIDLERYVHDHAKVDLSGRQVTLPETVELDGVTFVRISISSGPNLASEESSLLRAIFLVKMIDDGIPRFFTDATPVVPNTRRIVVVSKRLP